MEKPQSKDWGFFIYGDSDGENVFAQPQAGPVGMRPTKGRTIPSSARDIKAPNKAKKCSNTPYSPPPIHVFCDKTA